MKHDDGRDPNAFVMKNMSEGSSSRSRDPYDEDAMFGKETYSVEARGQLGRSKIQAGESDESILQHNDHEKRSSATRAMTIVKTTEVAITR